MSGGADTSDNRWQDAIERARGAGQRASAALGAAGLAIVGSASFVQDLDRLPSGGRAVLCVGSLGAAGLSFAVALWFSASMQVPDVMSVDTMPRSFVRRVEANPDVYLGSMGLTLDDFLRNRGLRRKALSSSLQKQIAARMKVRRYEASVNAGDSGSILRVYEQAKADLSNIDDLCATMTELCRDYDRAMSQLLDCARFEAAKRQVRLKLSGTLVSAMLIPVFAVVALLSIRPAGGSQTNTTVLVIPATSSVENDGSDLGLWDDRCPGRFDGVAVMLLLGGSGGDDDPWRLRTLPDLDGGCVTLELAFDSGDVVLIGL